jgi:hypothetical protein
VHYGATGARNIDSLFFMLGWTQCGSHKKRARGRYTKFVFLHPGGSVGHVVRSGASERKILMHYFLCSGRPGVDLTKTAAGHNRPKLCFCILVCLGHEMSTYFFS